MEKKAKRGQSLHSRTTIIMILIMSVNKYCSHSSTILRRAGANVYGSCQACGRTLVKSPKVMLWKSGFIEPLPQGNCDCPRETPVEIYRTGPVLKVKCIRCDNTLKTDRSVLVETNSVMSPPLRTAIKSDKSRKLLSTAKHKPAKREVVSKGSALVLPAAS